MYNVLMAIKKDYSPEWLFALGCYHPSRYKKFDEIGIWGSDYKGWIFNYNSRIEELLRLNKELKVYELNNGIDKHFKENLNEVDKIYQTIEELKKIWKNEKDTKKKRTHYNTMKREIEKLKDLMSKLGYWRTIHTHNNGVSREYMELVRKYNIILSYNDQIWRFKEVQNYVEMEVYGRLKQSSGGNSI